MGIWWRRAPSHHSSVTTGMGDKSLTTAWFNNCSLPVSQCDLSAWHGLVDPARSPSETINCVSANKGFTELSWRPNRRSGERLVCSPDPHTAGGLDGSRRTRCWVCSPEGEHTQHRYFRGEGSAACKPLFHLVCFLLRGLLIDLGVVGRFGL